MDNHQKFKALVDLGAGEFVHINGSLINHLEGTRSLLSAWGSRECLLDAGLFHAAYGTAAFERSMVSIDQRVKVSEVIGLDAEDVVYKYCACDRDYVWPQFGDANEIDFRDRFTKSSINMSTQDLKDFCELTVANELEIAKRSDEFVNLYGRELNELFSRMSLYLSQSASAAFKEVFENVCV